eukprot:m.33908 g.33908  ORF g.33908 m.33908 type:complete len:148 (+) comp31926_c0_seq3:867-1310(+)
MLIFTYSRMVLNLCGKLVSMPFTPNHVLIMDRFVELKDDANRAGGKWMIRLRKGLSARYWEQLILAILGEQFMVGDELCGAVVSMRFQEDIISVWNRTASNRAVTERIRDTMMRVLSLPPNTVIEYKCHNASLKDNSSFRNTDVFVR